MNNDNFSSNFKNLRCKNSISQKGFAGIMQISQQTIAHLENNYRKPSYELLIKIADYFNVSIDYLVGRTDVPEVNKKNNTVVTNDNGIIFRKVHL